MTLFTDSPYEKMMIRKPEDGKRDKSPPASFPPRCAGCPYRVLYQTNFYRPFQIDVFIVI